MARTETLSLSRGFEDIRNYLAGRAIGITRDKSLLHEVVKCLFCKIYSHESKKTLFSEQDIAIQYRKIFSALKKQLPDIFTEADEILIDPGSINFIDSIFNKVDLVDYHNDPLSLLYQTFIGSEIRGNEGQFFTPTEAVRLLVEAVDPNIGDRIIDPACGAGSFLSYASRHLIQKGAKADVVAKNIYGIEKDDYLSRLSQTHVALTTFKSSNIVCGDSIERKIKNNEQIPFELNEQFDIVFANPPFGAKIKIGSDQARTKFDLAYAWVRDRKTGRFQKTQKFAPNPSPQILFLELCIKLLKPNGKLGIVVPESLISSLGSSYVCQYLLDEMVIEAVIGMPENLFKTSGKGGTHTKTCLLVAKKKSKKTKLDTIFMAEAKWCGHDSRGNLIPHNDLPVILDKFQGKKIKNNSVNLGYNVKTKDLVDNILAPRYYNPEPLKALDSLKKTHELICLGDLVNAREIEISSGDEIGKLSYGTGEIPFVRTSDISNWEIKLDPKHGVSQEIFESYSKKQDVREGDILMVRDGTYLIGTCAYVSKYDTKIIYQSHLYKIRVHSNCKISAYLLLAALSSKPVVDQIQAKRFTQDIIDTLGKRIYELILPIPKDSNRRNSIERIVRKSIEDRIESRELARKAKVSIVEI